MLALDEEIDFIEYQRYLRSQSNSELFDILAHLDYLRCPRRAEAANRELRRRELTVGRSYYADSENLWRKAAMLVIAVVFLTLLLGSTMSKDEALQPQPPPSLDLYTDGSMVQFEGNAFDGGDRMTAAVIGVYMAQVAENFLRAAVQLFSQWGCYLAMLSITTGKLYFSMKTKQNEDALSQDLRRLLLIAFFGQMLIIISATWNNLPVLALDGHSDCGQDLARGIEFIAPWA